MTKSSVTRINKKLMNKKEDMSGQVYVKSAKDFEIAKEIALLLAPKLHSAADGNYLIQLQTLDILQDNLALQAIHAKRDFLQKDKDETNNN